MNRRITKTMAEDAAAIETKEVVFELELAKYVSKGIHRFFPGVEDDYCVIDSVVWQDYIIKTATYFYELGHKY